MDARHLQLAAAAERFDVACRRLFLSAPDQRLAALAEYEAAKAALRQANADFQSRTAVPCLGASAQPGGMVPPGPSSQDER